LGHLPCSHPLPAAFRRYFRDYVATLTGQAPEWPARPVIYPNEQDQAEADALWEKLQLDRHPHITACFVTSRQPIGVWPVTRFGETLAALRRKRETHILLCGSAGDEGVLTGVNRDFGLGAEVIAGSLGLRALCCFLRRCSVVLTTDSGPRHIANAACVPVVFVRNVWFNAIEAGVYVDTETDLCARTGEGLAAIDPARAAEVVAAI
jgi:ADP-heptose:LPS heptosyltransferase